MHCVCVQVSADKRHVASAHMASERTHAFVYTVCRRRIVTSSCVVYNNNMYTVGVLRSLAGELHERVWENLFLFVFISSVRACLLASRWRRRTYCKHHGFFFFLFFYFYLSSRASSGCRSLLLLRPDNPSCGPGRDLHAFRRPW